MKSPRWLAGLVVLLLGLHGWTAPATGARLATAGWWWRVQTGVLALPAPPHVPEQGLAVGQAADGPTAISALRFALDSDETDPVLSLVVAESAAAADVGLVACPSAAPWFGVQAGGWDERPEAACSAGTVNGAESEDGASWTFALAPLYDDGLLDVVIMPAEGSAPFEMSFEPPSSESLRTTRAPDSTDFDPGFASPGPGTDDGFALPPSGFEGADFGPPPLSSDPLATQGGATGPAEVPPQEGEQRFVAIARPGITGTEDGDPRLLAVVILLAALAAAVTLGREPLPAPRLLGPMAARDREPGPDEMETRGLGRFRRPRQGTPPALH